MTMNHLLLIGALLVPMACGPKADYHNDACDCDCEEGHCDECEAGACACDCCAEHEDGKPDDGHDGGGDDGGCDGSCPRPGE